MGTERVKITIIKGVEIELGQPVPVLEHSGCHGKLGTVASIDGADYKITCNSCGRAAILDIPVMGKKKKSP